MERSNQSKDDEDGQYRPDGHCVVKGCGGGFSYIVDIWLGEYFGILEICPNIILKRSPYNECDNRYWEG